MSVDFKFSLFIEVVYHTLHSPLSAAQGAVLFAAIGGNFRAELQCKSIRMA